MGNFGEVAEWSKASHSKCDVRETAPWVQIPPSPQKTMKSFIAYRFSGEDPKNIEPVLRGTVDALKARGIDSYCTFFDNDDVRDTEKTAREIMSHAFSIIDASDFLFVILMSEEKSEGMIMEVGYCIAKKIPIVIAVKEGIQNTYLPQMTSHTFTWADSADLSLKIGSMEINKLKAQG